MITGINNQWEHFKFSLTHSTFAVMLTRQRGIQTDIDDTRQYTSTLGNLANFKPFSINHSLQINMQQVWARNKYTAKRQNKRGSCWEYVWENWQPSKQNDNPMSCSVFRFQLQLSSVSEKLRASLLHWTSIYDYTGSFWLIRILKQADHLILHNYTVLELCSYKLWTKTV